MEITKITTVKPNPKSVKGDHVSFYFKNIRDARKFIAVFDDHWCHVKFNIIKEPFKSIPKNIEDEIKLDPELRAEEMLEWGFNFAKAYGDDKQTYDEKVFINDFIKKLGNKLS